MSWDTGLCACCDDCKILIVTYFCPVCQLAQQRATISGHDCGLGDLLCAWCLAPCAFIDTRQKIRTKYGIAGGFCGDLCTMCFCSFCAIAQHSRQMQAKGDKPSGFCMEK